MAPSSSSSRIILFAFLLLLAAVFWHISLIAPHVQDDYWLNFVMEKNADGSVNYTTRLISNWNDLIESWLTRRELIQNGRISDFLCALVMRCGGRELFAILNTLAMLAMVGLFSRYCFRKVTLWSVLAILSVFILFNPNIDGTLFWMAGACNYLWGSVLLGAFLLCLNRVMEGGERRRLAVLLGSAAGFGCGILHEGLGAPLVGGMIAYWFIGIIRGRKLPPGYKWLLLFTALGTLVTMTAPSMWIRASRNMGWDSIAGFAKAIALAFLTDMTMAGLPLLALFVLFWKKRDAVFSPLMWIALMLFALTLVTCDTGIWGGSFYYVSIASLLLFLKATAAWWERHKRIVSSILLPLAACACAYEHCHMAKVSQQFHNILSSPKQNGVCIVDWQSEQGNIPWMLGGAIPTNMASFKYPYCGRLFGQDDFYVVFRTAEADPSLYAQFEGQDEASPCIIRWKKGYAIRLPRQMDSHSSIIAHSPQGDLYLNPKTKSWGLMSTLHARLKKRELGYFSEDWDHGFHYIILPGEVSHYETLSFKIAEDSRFGTGKEMFPPESTLVLTIPQS